MTITATDLVEIFKRIDRIEETLDRIEKRTNMVLSAVLDIQMTIQNGAANRTERKQQMTTYIEGIKSMLAQKGLDTAMFDQFLNLMG